MLLLISSMAWAQEFTAAVSKNQVGTGEAFEVAFSVNGNGERFTPPSFSGFQLASGPNVSTSMTSINGNTTVSNSYSYILLPTKEGTFTIGAASMVVDGRKMTTNPIRITVVKGQPVQQNRQSQSQGQGVPESRLEEGRAADLSKQLFIKADVDKTSVYQGEQLTLSYRLYTRTGIVDSRVDKMPDLNGFWSQDIKNQSEKAQWRVIKSKGVEYNVADVKQTILFPEHSGNITINPFEMTFIVRVAGPPRDIMEQFFGGSYKDVKYAVKSSPVVIHVKPLPEAGKPASFTGAVGKFSVATSLDKAELKSNETMNYTIKVSGSGNIKLLKTLTTAFPENIEKYDPKITDTLSENNNGVSGSRLYNYLLIPRRSGNYTIPPLEFSYFNPSTRKYVVQSTQPFNVKVNKGPEEENVTAFSAANKQEEKLQDKDLRPLKTGSAQLSRKNNSFYGSFLYYSLLLLGPLCCVGVFIFRNRNRALNSDIMAVRNRRAGKVAAKHLAVAQKEFNAHRNKEFYEAIFKGLYGYLGDKLSISAATLNRENISAMLRQRAVSQATTDHLLEVLDVCEMARYAPVNQVSDQEIMNKAKGIINAIENEIS